MTIIKSNLLYLIKGINVNKIKRDTIYILYSFIYCKNLGFFPFMIQLIVFVI